MPKLPGVNHPDAVRPLKKRAFAVSFWGLNMANTGLRPCADVDILPPAQTAEPEAGSVACGPRSGLGGVERDWQTDRGRNHQCQHAAA